MKKLLATLIALSIVLTGCGGGQTATPQQNASKTEAKQETVQQEAKTEPEVEITIPEREKMTLSASEFDEFIKIMPIYIESTDYVVQDKQFKALYPDLLEAIIKNNTNQDIKDVTVAFVGWDDNNLPLKLKEQIDFTDGDYIRTATFEGANIIPGATYGKGEGFELYHELTVSKFKAIVKGFTTFEDRTWTNPYYDSWATLYGGKKLSDDLSTTVYVEDPFCGYNDISKDGVELLLSNQLVRVIETKEDRADRTILRSFVYNESEKTVSEIVIGYVAFDASGNPVMLYDPDGSNGAYVKGIDVKDQKITSGSLWGADNGLVIKDDDSIQSIKALVVGYITSDGASYRNQIFENWKALYEGVPLN